MNEANCVSNKECSERRPVVLHKTSTVAELPLADRQCLSNRVLPLAFCSDQQAESPTGSTLRRKAQRWRLTKRPLTVADSIQMTRLGDPLYTEGGPSKGIVAKFSPDGKHFVVVLKKGNLQANTNEYSLVLFQTADVFQSPTPRVLVSLASSSNRPAIDSVRWLEDNDTILFLGERPGEQTQLYSLKCGSDELKKLTSSATCLTSFATTANGEEIVYSAKNPVSTFLTESASTEWNHCHKPACDRSDKGQPGGRRLGRRLFVYQAIRGGSRN